jgi:hypothetical protein
MQRERRAGGQRVTQLVIILSFRRDAQLENAAAFIPPVRGSDDPSFVDPQKKLIHAGRLVIRHLRMTNDQ